MVVLGAIRALRGGFCAYFWVFLSHGSLVAFFGYSDRWGSEPFA